ncbi:MAG: hypothetical protein AAF938_21110 [Myxococcota bacterium]
MRQLQREVAGVGGVDARPGPVDAFTQGFFESQILRTKGVLHFVRCAQGGEGRFLGASEVLLQALNGGAARVACWFAAAFVGACQSKASTCEAQQYRFDAHVLVGAEGGVECDLLGRVARVVLGELCFEQEEFEAREQGVVGAANLEERGPSVAGIDGRFERRLRAVAMPAPTDVRVYGFDEGSEHQGQRNAHAESH